MRFSKSFLVLALVALASTFSLAATPAEVLAEMNMARTQPHAYADVLMQEAGASSRDVAEAVRFLQRAQPLAPLASSEGLEQSSMLHVATQGPKGGRGHGSGWNTPFTRMEKYGQWLGTAGENIYYGRRTARGIVCALIIDSGVSGRGHRKNIFSRSFGVAGVACGYHSGYGSMCVIDFAGQYLERGGKVAVR